MKNLQFKIQGEYITQTADELLQNGDMKKAITVLHGSTLSGEITEKEHRLLVYDILDGRARIVGTYPTDDYDVIYPEDKKNSSNIADILAKITKENTKLKEQIKRTTGSTTGTNGLYPGIHERKPQSHTTGNV